MGTIWTNPQRIVVYWIPEGATEPGAAFFTKQFAGITLTKRTLAEGQVLNGGPFPTGRLSSASTTAATLSDASLTTNQQNTLNAGLRRRQMRDWLRSWYDSGYLSLSAGTNLNAVTNLLTMISVCCSHDANLISRWNFINSWLDFTPGDIIKNINTASWSAITPFGPTGTQFHTFNENGTANAVSATFFMTGNNNTLRNFVL